MISDSIGIRMYEWEHDAEPVLYKEPWYKNV